MRIFVRILAVLFIILWMGVVTCYIYIRLNGRQLVIETLSEVFHEPVRLEATYFLFPFGLRINDLKVGEKKEVIQIKDVQVQIGIPDLFHRRVHLLFMRLSQPVLNITRAQNSKMILGNVDAQATAPQTNKENLAVKQVPLSDPSTQKVNLMIDYLVVERGEIKFRDFSREKKFELTLQDIGLKAKNVAIPSQPVNTKFDLKADIFKEMSLSDLPFSASRIDGRGWVNFYKRDMQAKFDVVDSVGKVFLTSQINSKDNEMAIDGKVHISNFIAPANSQTDASASSLKDLIFSSLQSSGVEIVADFHSKTKMDDFHWDAVTFSGNLGYKPATPTTSESPKSPEEEKNIGQHFEELGKKFYKKNVQEQMNKEVPSAQ